jgi:hypothetical protein
MSQLKMSASLLSETVEKGTDQAHVLGEIFIGNGKTLQAGRGVSLYFHCEYST